MLYLLRTGQHNGNNIYSLIDTNTDSVLKGDTNFVIRLVERYKMELKNAYITNGDRREICMSEVLQKESKDDYYVWRILLAKINENTYKTVDDYGRVEYIDRQNLIDRIKACKVMNCKMKPGSDTSFEAEYTYEIETDKEFVSKINTEYNKFIAKGRMIGLDNSFEYTVEGHEVKIVYYTGESTKVIIPNFVTSITEQAFYNKQITEVKLGSSLRFIGSNAFRLNKIEKIDIPETVEYLGQWTLLDNKIGYGDLKIAKSTIPLGRVVSKGSLDEFALGGFNLEYKKTATDWRGIVECYTS